MPLTFVHTADWHLGRVYRNIGPNSARTPGWREDAVRRVYDLAVRERAEFILVAGDVFDTETPRMDVAARAVDLLRDAPVPLIVIPGNHDPCMEGSVWKRRDFEQQLVAIENLKLALQPTVFPIGDADILAIPCAARTWADDLTNWMDQQPRHDGRYRIGLAHGCCQGYSGDQYFENVIAADRANLSGLDYLALGDFHSYTVEGHWAAHCRTRYSGTIECTAVDEDRPGHALLVTIPAPGEPPVVRPEFVGHIQPRCLGQLTVSPDSGIQPLEREVDALSSPERVILGLKVVGVLTVDQMQQFQDWAGRLNSRFLGVDLDQSALYMEPGDQDWIDLGLRGAEQTVLTALRERELQHNEGDPVPANLVVQAAADASIRREALALYYQMLREGRG